MPLLAYSDGVIRLAAVPQWLLQAPTKAGHLEVATDRVRWSERQPGPPDPGPAIVRYLPTFDTFTIVAAVAIVIALVAFIRSRRRRR